MGATIRIELNKPNIRKMLKSEEVARALTTPAEKIQARANAGSGDEGHDIKTFVGHDRVSLLILPVSWNARRAEAETRNLTRSLEAGRG